MLKQLGFVSVSVPRAREVMEGTAGVVYEASGAVTLPEHSFVRSMVSGAMAQALDDKKVARRGRRTVLVKRRTTILPGAKTTEVPALVPTLSTTDKLVRWTLRRRLVSTTLSGATQLLLLAHGGDLGLVLQGVS